MKTRNKQGERVRVKLLALAGGSALVALGVLGVAGGGSGVGPSSMADSGDGVANTYVQPVVKGMNLGSTATVGAPTVEAPPTAPETPFARPSK